jgi:hypothetical protein
VVAERVTVDEDLSHILALLVDSLQLLGNNVLSLTQLKDVLDSIYDFKRTPRKLQLANITSIEPAIFVLCLGC